MVGNGRAGTRPGRPTPTRCGRGTTADRPADEGGFTIVETVLAITIAAMVFTATALMLGQALKGTLLARQNEQAAEVLTAEIEAIRSMDYAAIAMVPSDLTGDAAVTGTPAAVDHDRTGPLAAEPVSVSATGGVNPHIRTLQHNGTTYTITRYVSEVTDTAVASARVKRVTAIARWQSGSREHERISSTLVTRTRRGLPLPEFSFGSKVSKVVAPGGQIVLPATITNRGARDRWNLSVTTTPTLTGTWSWYLDGGTAGTPDGVVGADDLALIDTDADAASRVDTGYVEVDQTKVLLAVYDATVPDPAAASYAVTLAAQSSAQPAATGGSATIVDTVQVVTPASASCPTCVAQTYVLHNTLPVCAASCDTKAQDPLPLDAAAATATGLFDFDTDTDTAASGLKGGRRVLEGGAGVTETSRAKMVRWSRQLGVATKVSGPASLRFHVAPLDSGTDGTVTFTTFLVKRANGGGSGDVVLASADTTVTGSLATSFELKQVDFTLPTTSFGKNDRIEVRVVVKDDATAADAIRIAYDNTTTAGTLTYSVIP